MIIQIAKVNPVVDDPPPVKAQEERGAYLVTYRLP